MTKPGTKITQKIPVAVFISGSGSNLQSLIEACEDPSFPAKIVLVISNRPDVKGLDRARAADIKALTIDHKAYPTRTEFEAALNAALDASPAKLVCLAGFMRVLSADFVRPWQERILNIHPSLLPSFKGLHVQQQAIDAGVNFSGCTVHLVTPDLDDGPIIGQAVVPVLADDDANTLSARIMIEEHKLYPDCLAILARRLMPLG